MSAESKPDFQPEIAHILCTDIVGYSKLLIDLKYRWEWDPIRNDPPASLHQGILALAVRANAEFVKIALG